MKKNLSQEDVENLPYYDFMSYMGASFFQLGGPGSMEQLAELCHIDSTKKVLEVGCGTGFNACNIARKFGCSIVGVDIAQVSIEMARVKAKKEGLEKLVEFRAGDAYDLPFEPDAFDVVITGFVSQFLDMGKAFREFTRVLKPGGLVGINEMYKDSDIPKKEGKEIQDVEDMLKGLTKLPFVLNSPEEWKEKFENAGLEDVQIIKSRDYLGFRDAPIIIKEMGGWWELLKVFWRMIKYSIISRKTRDRFSKLQKVKFIFLRKKSTAKYVGYLLGVGRKPLLE